MEGLESFIKKSRKPKRQCLVNTLNALGPECFGLLLGFPLLMYAFTYIKKNLRSILKVLKSINLGKRLKVKF